MNDNELLSKQAIKALVAREKLAFVGRLLKGVVHNISGAVQMVRLPLDLMELRLEAMDLDQIRQKIDSSQQGLVKLTEEIGLLASRSSQVQRTSPDPVDINQLVREQLPFWKADPYFKHQINLDLQTDDSLPLLKVGYVDVSLAFNEVIANAVDSLNNSKAVDMSVRVFHESGNAVLEVTDSGPGPAAEISTNMFEPFTGDKDGDHDGLGLFLANVVLSNWSGGVTWQPSRPTTFSVHIPIN